MGHSQLLFLFQYVFVGSQYQKNLLFFDSEESIVELKQQLSEWKSRAQVLVMSLCIAFLLLLFSF